MLVKLGAKYKLKKKMDKIGSNGQLRKRESRQKINSTDQIKNLNNTRINRTTSAKMIIKSLMDIIWFLTPHPTRRRRTKIIKFSLSQLRATILSKLMKKDCNCSQMNNKALMFIKLLLIDLIFHHDFHLTH